MLLLFRQEARHDREQHDHDQGIKTEAAVHAVATSLPVVAAGAPAVMQEHEVLDRVKVNNRLRGSIDAVLGSLTLMSPDPKVRRAAADDGT